MVDPPKVSIIICTCNRDADLRQTLASLSQVHVPSGVYVELIVVDNASTDGTAEAVKSCQLPNMQVCYIYEGRRGKGYAYNTGIAAAKGDILVSTDDDVRPSVDWITEICKPITRGEADAVVGAVNFPASHATAISREPYVSRKSLFASTDFFDHNNPDTMVGANMAFSRHVLTMVPFFNTEIGPGALGFGDDTLFAKQLLSAGFRLKYVDSAKVEHHFDLTRLKRHHLLRTVEKVGRTDAYLCYHWEGRHIPIRPAHLARMWAGFLWHKIFFWRDWINADVPAPWEIRFRQEWAFYCQLRIEQRRPPRYINGCDTVSKLSANTAECVEV